MVMLSPARYRACGYIIVYNILYLKTILNRLPITGHGKQNYRVLKLNYNLQTSGYKYTKLKSENNRTLNTIIIVYCLLCSTLIYY